MSLAFRSEEMSDRPQSPLPDTEMVHGSCVAMEDRGLLILGRSGTGKSSLALSLMALGARLVSDDQVILTRRVENVIASAPSELQGLIEARGIGILKAEAGRPVPVTLIVDMDTTEKRRLPDYRTRHVLGVALPLLYRVDSPHFSVSILQMMRSGRRDPA